MPCPYDRRTLRERPGLQRLSLSVGTGEGIMPLRAVGGADRTVEDSRDIAGLHLRPLALKPLA